MMTTSISSNYLATALLPSIAQTQSTLAADGVEESTGQYANLGLQLGDQSGYELSLKNENELLQTLTTSNSLVTTNLTTAQDALNSILTDAQNAQSTMTTWTSESTSSPSTLQTTGSEGLQGLIAAANTTSNGAYVFGGDNSSVAPMNDYTTITNSLSQAFQSYFNFPLGAAGTASLTVSQMQGFLDDPSYTGLFSSAWSNASSTNTTAQIAPGQTIETSTNANQPGFQQLAQGYALLAVFGASSLSSSVQQLVASTATSLITQGVSSTTATEASVGASLSQVSDATSSMSSQMTILQTQIGNLDDVNATTVATQLETLSTQLQTAYSLTAQLQKLSLAQYIPT
jgi:flagellar hook-associated protein 3 FlgL